MTKPFCSDITRFVQVHGSQARKSNTIATHFYIELHVLFSTQTTLQGDVSNIHIPTLKPLLILIFWLPEVLTNDANDHHHAGTCYYHIFV